MALADIKAFSRMYSQITAASDWPCLFLHPRCFCLAYTYTSKCVHSYTYVDAAEILEPLGGQIQFVVEGHNITLRCTGVGYPPPLVQWSKINELLSDRTSTTNMSMLTNEGNVTNVTVDLIFTGTYRDDTGVYECSVSNLLNVVTRNVSLTVQCM